jgi:diguanylate cyclase (GGDEF)-like protein
VSGQLKEQEAAFRLGAVDFIAKPFQTSLLLARVRIHVNLKLRTDFLESQASVDALTGIGNRRHFDLAYRSEWRRAARNLTPMSLLMVDVDHFKQFNDLYGHGAGDECLRKISGILATAGLRPSDSVTRYGGEEFALILPGCGDGGANTVGNRIRTLVEEAAIPHGHSPSAHVVTISVGIATRNPSPVGNMSELLLAADKALYKAKQTGRNRVCCD